MTKPINPLAFNATFKYAPAPESMSHIQLKHRYELFINGKFVAPSGGKYFDTINPQNQPYLLYKQ